MLKTFNDSASEFGDRLFGVDGSNGQDLSNYLMEKSHDEMTRLMIEVVETEILNFGN